jgi:hypothetical protein
LQYLSRHDLPEFIRVLNTFAVRETDFALIDVAFGPLSDIALSEDTSYDPADLAILPPTALRRLAGQPDTPVEVLEHAKK